jgi:hypothetical protein
MNITVMYGQRHKAIPENIGGVEGSEAPEGAERFD